MEDRKSVKKTIPVLLGLFLLAPTTTSAYSASTHRNITAATVDLYNQHFSEEKIPEELKQFLIEGSEREDEALRWLHHFFDPIYDRGLTVAGLAFMKSKDWAQYEDNLENWQAALDYWRTGNKEKAMLVLGHVVHLLQDKAVSDHTRNDPHIGDSPYEVFTRRLSPKNFEGKSVVVLGSLNQYFDELAEYSNNGFYSKDTTNGSEYQEPKIDYEKTDGNYLYGFRKDGEFGDYHLVALRNGLWGKKKGFLIEGAGSLNILQDYWDRLSVKSIQYGAGLIHLFFEETAQLVKQKKTNQTRQYWSGLANVIAIFQGDNNGSSGSGRLQLADEIDLLDNSLPAGTGSAPTTVPKPPLAKAAPICQFSSALAGNGSPAVIINEVAWMGSKINSDHEWLELRNPTTSQVVISGWWLLSADNQIKINFPAGAAAPASGYYLLERKEDQSVPDVKADLIYSGALANKGEHLRLLDNDCRLVDEVNAVSGWPAGNNDEKRTMERKSDLAWQTYLWSDLPHILGTPKMANSFGQMAATYIAPGSANKNLPPQSGASQPPPPAPSPGPPPSPSPPPPSLSPPPPPPAPKNVVQINEFLFDAAGSDNDKEFIEIYNTSGETIDISGWSIQTPTAKKNFEAGHAIAPSGFFLIWLGPHPLSDMEWLSGSLKNTSSTIYLVRKQQVISDSDDPDIENKVDYDADNLPGFTPGYSWDQGQAQPTPNPQGSRGPAAVRFYYSPLTGGPVIELNWTGSYPFLLPYFRPDPDSLFWKILVLYLNPDPLTLGSRLPPVLNTNNGWEPPDTSGVVAVKYPNYTGTEGAGRFSLILPDDVYHSGNAGGIMNSAFDFNQIQDQKIIVKAASPENFLNSDYLQVVYYDFFRSGGGQQQFALLGLDGRRHFFEP